MPVVSNRFDPMNPESDPFYQEEIKEAIRTRKWLAGHDMAGEDKWIVRSKNIPCAWYAISVLAPKNGITSVSRAATRNRQGYWCAVACVKKGDGKLASMRFGASAFHDRQMALAFACRNAIKFLLPQEVDTREPLAYRTTQDNAIEKYA